VSLANRAKRRKVIFQDKLGMPALPGFGSANRYPAAARLVSFELYSICDVDKLQINDPELADIGTQEAKK
jgi:hypothetical protein